eukprot:CAMPEP_0172773012 /NCGR_PEP_ID=MMETSP1074-20121228/193517_1 /TAXON_ID=2916 /ORGANISM="Ceratium fusus, Strain PA161109" /LENGTH=51 /DNA_ID=CAMNT_0013609225 /DNA_START=39 /DNA_END=190 /DNA_ORIENTATION=+
MSLPPPDPRQMAADADWSRFHHFLLQRVRAGNALPGPRMRLVHWKTLKTFG